MTRSLSVITSLALLVWMVPAAHAEGNAAAGKNKAVVCFACHGRNGNSLDSQYPRLAGQYPAYIVQALKEYKDGQRKNPLMVGFASTLSQQDRMDIAAYFGSQKPVLWTLKGFVEGSNKGF